MELFPRFAARYPTRFAAYVALEVALIRRFVARGGTEEEFCARLAPVFHRRYAPLLAAPARTVALHSPLRLVSASPREAHPERPRPRVPQLPAA
jgi:hypothetical protein